MSKKIFRSIIIVAVTVLLASLVMTNSYLYRYFNNIQSSRLKDELALATAGVEQSGAEYFDRLSSSQFRFTLVSHDGVVLYDSEVNSKKMENHLDRKEIQQALKYGTGNSTRYSSTLTEQTFYEAVLLKNGDVLRISTTQVTIGALIIGMSPAISAIILVSIVIAIILSHRMASSIVKPLNELDLEHPTDNNTYEELAPVLTKINKQHKQIKKQLKELKRRSDEFEQITAHMTEGLILLDKNGTVISLNAAAKGIFAVDDTVIGQSFLTIDRGKHMRHAIERAYNGKNGEFGESRNGREYRFIINRTVSDEKLLGVVVLCLDITEAAFAESRRREFTANVSHELKTPLQSIIGSAELLENGLVKPEDTAKFVGNIKTEASRLVTLINDIIRLSQLDEQSELPSETVDLCALTNEVCATLVQSASKKNVTLTVGGEDCTVNGVRGYLYEIIYNLCDNAIRYNNDGGKVQISLSNKDGKAYIAVADSGIGIAPEDRERIFERFYRVDKSHSKETGGTGLGLSIVKHAVAYHGGSVALESELGKGTTIKVII